MHEPQNSPQNSAEREIPSSGAPQPKPKKLWSSVLAFLNYLAEDVPDETRKDGASAEKPRKKKSAFNAFLDFLEKPVTEPSDPSAHGGLLKKTGNICWEIILHGTVVVFLFALAIFCTVKALDFVHERHVPLYPSDEVRQYLAAEHESLEAVADALPVGKDRGDNIPLDRFGETCAGIVRPVKIYSDEYGVYLMTSKSWYVGENGVFIARDKDRMPDDMSWGLIEGRIFAYAFFK
jgi:hypothetical protein